MKTAIMRDDANFRDAFAAASAAGADEFVWRGSRYITETRAEIGASEPDVLPKEMIGWGKARKEPK